MQLTLIGTNSNDSKAVYKLLTERNTEIILYIKYRSNPEQRKKEGSDTWIFNFTPNNLQELGSYEKGEFWIALICGKEGQMSDSEVCLLDKLQVSSYVDTNSKSNQSLTVKLPSGKGFRVYGTKAPGEQPMIISRNRLDTISI